MNTKWNRKSKDASGKYFTYGNVLPGEKGPRCGLRVTPELRALIAGKPDGEWVNLLMFEDDGERRGTQPAADIPF